MIKFAHSSIFTNTYPHRAEAFKRDGYKCRKCGSTENMIIHHIDNSRKNGKEKINNNLDNLITLCRICHAKIHGQNLRFSNPNKKIIQELRENGKTYEEIGEYLGITRQRVHQIVKKLV